MSATFFDEMDFVRPVPENIMKRTKENMEVYNMDLYDSFQEAVKALIEEGTELWKALYYDDFRKYIPCAYYQKYLDFKKYPLKYADK